MPKKRIRMGLPAMQWITVYNAHRPMKQRWVAGRGGQGGAGRGAAWSGGWHGLRGWRVDTGMEMRRLPDLCSCKGESLPPAWLLPASTSEPARSTPAESCPPSPAFLPPKEANLGWSCALCCCAQVPLQCGQQPGAAARGQGQRRRALHLLGRLLPGVPALACQGSTRRLHVEATAQAAGLRVCEDEGE